MQTSYYFEPLLFSSLAYISRGRTLSSTQFDMQVKGEAIEERIRDKEATYQRSISVFHISNIGCTSEAYITSISVLYINNRSNISEVCFNNLGLCQVRVILASSLKAEHSWWIFVSDLTLLMQ
jgi:hypothetical protein